MAEHVAEEESKVDRLYDILVREKEPKSFYQLADQVFTKDEVESDHGETLARLYTTLTLDGRFLSVGHNLWALRNWYPMDQREDDIAKTLGDDVHERNKKIAEDGFDDYDEDDETGDDADEDEDTDEVDSSDEDDYDDDSDDNVDADVDRIRRNAVPDNDDEE